MVQIYLNNPSAGEAECLAITEANTWMTSIIQYLELGICKSEEEKTIRQQCARYTMIDQDLYKRGYSMPLLKCVTKEQAKYVFGEIHEGACGNHSAVQTMAAKVLRVGYFWSTIQSDYVEYMKKCTKCQEYNPMSHLTTWYLHVCSPFGEWTSFFPSAQARDKQNLSWSESTTLSNRQKPSLSPPSRPRTSKILYGGTFYVRSGSPTPSLLTMVGSSLTEVFIIFTRIST